MANAAFEKPMLLVERISEYLMDAIIEGRLKTGQQLVEAELQNTFGVSRSPIREAFRILDGKGLVVTLPRKGVFVRGVTIKDIQENFPVRASLEALAARLAVSNMTGRDIKAMKASLTKMRRAAERDDPKAFFRHHYDFHEVFIHASRNETLIQILEGMRKKFLWFRYTYLYQKESYDSSLRVHHEILDLFSKKKTSKLEALVKSHIEIATAPFLEYLQRDAVTSAEDGESDARFERQSSFRKV
jgi:DNA-binding GntR family transcriptional regulator